MKLIENSEAQKIITSHLDAMLSLCKSWLEPKDNNISNKDWFEIMSKDFQTHLDIAWYMLDRYLNLQFPSEIADHYRERLIIGYTICNIHKNKSKAENDTLQQLLEKLIETIKIDDGK